MNKFQKCAGQGHVYYMRIRKETNKIKQQQQEPTPSR